MGALRSSRGLRVGLRRWRNGPSVAALRWCSIAARVGCFPFIERISGDGGYRGAKAAKASRRMKAAAVRP